MKNIGIVTIIDYNNYGNRLQNYAVQELLKEMNSSVSTLRINIDHGFTRKEKIRNMIKKGLVTSIKEKVMYRINKKLKLKKYGNIINSREKHFINFTNKYINETKWYQKTELKNDKTINQLDYVVIGSDQIWNPNFRKGFEPDFGTFVEPSKRVALSPSFGVSSIDEAYITDYSKYLSEINSLSVREDAGAEIIYKLTGRKAPVILDPTLSIPRQKWEQISNPAKYKPKNKYVLTYFLGKVPTDAQEVIDELVSKFDYEVVNLSELNAKKYYDAGPAEFLDYIKDTELFFTDSYHGSVFSIIFNSNFITFDRNSNTPSMSSRIDTLLSKFELEDRKWEVIKKNGNYLDTDFSHVGKILNNERQNTLEYLRNNLS